MPNCHPLYSIESLICAECGREIKNKYYTCLDNYIQFDYFVSEEENIFCSQECLNKAMSIEKVIVKDEKKR